MIDIAFISVMGSLNDSSSWRVIKRMKLASPPFTDELTVCGKRWKIITTTLNVDLLTCDVYLRPA